MSAHPDTGPAFRAARTITRRHAKTFYLASLVLPARTQKAFHAVYAFCRHADDTIDETADASHLDAAVAGLRDLTNRLYGSDPVPDLPWAPAFQETLCIHGIPRDLCDQLIHGVTLDTRIPVRIPDWPGLRDYCRHVASAAGLMLACVLELRRPDALRHAAQLGIAMQLTNILRDVVADARRDRVYLPADELDAFGLSQDDLPSQISSPGWRDYGRFFAGRARDHYASAEAGIPALAPGRPQLAVWCLREIYAGILDEIEAADFDVSIRRHVPAPRKLVLFCRAFRQWGQSRKHHRE